MKSKDSSIEFEKLKKQLALIKEIVTNETYNLGDDFFKEVVLKLNESLNADYTFIGKLNNEDDNITTLALCHKRNILENFKYRLEHTPCQNVVGKKVCSYANKVTQLFPKDELLIEMGIEAYVGVPLFNSKGKGIGIMVSLFRNPIEDIETLESVLLIFASRAGAEIEHRENQNKLHLIQKDLEDKNNEYLVLNEEYLCLNEELQERNLQLEETNKQLFANEEKFKMLFEHSGTANAYFDLTGKLVFQNTVSAGYLKGTPTDFIGKSITDIFGKEQGKIVAERFKKIFERNKSEVYETSFDLPSGKKWFRTFYHPVYDSNQILSGVQIISQDITKEKIIEEELKQAIDKAQASEALLQKTQHIALMGNFRHNLVTNRTSWSENTKEIFGLNDADFDNNINEIIPKLIHPDDREMFLNKSLELIQKGGEGHMYYRIVSHTNEIKHISSYAQLVLDAQGQPKEIIGSVQDVSEIKRIEEQLIQAKYKAEESDRLKTAFLANMSHEIRTPMNGILGFTDLLADKNISDEERAEYVNVVKSCSQQLLNIISDIIDISKIEAEEFNLSNTTFNLRYFLDEIIQQAHIILKQKQKKNIKLFYTLNINVQKVTADKNRLAQILLNLLTNAIKFTETGSIELLCEPDSPNMVKFSVTDTGRGIEQSKHKQIFKRFRQAEEKDTLKGGTGLGLAICKALVEKMGGEISVVSEPNRGSTFTFTIKIDSEKTQDEQSVEVMVDEIKKDKIKILIAEDEDINYLYLFEALKSYNFDIKHALNGLEAVSMFSEDPPDVVLMDIKMPHMDGYQALEELKKINVNVPVIAITAYAMSSDEERAIAAGFKAYLPKPVSKKKLLAIINELT